MGMISCPETSVQNYHSTLRNIPEERRKRGGSLKIFQQLISGFHRDVDDICALLGYYAAWGGGVV
jgi:hypothetical protein